MSKVFFSLGLALFILLQTSVSYAFYADEVAAKPEELAKAVHTVLSYSGLKKANWDKNEFETRWITDKVTRSKGLLKSITSQVYERRYRLKVKLIPDYYSAKVEIRSIYQYRPDASGPAVSWRTEKPTSEELSLERDCFMRILTELAAHKKKT